jgi:nucleoside-diphosphate-sugar epimerase
MMQLLYLHKTLQSQHPYPSGQNAWLRPRLGIFQAVNPRNFKVTLTYNRQYGTQYLAAMPTNLHGPGNNLDLAD